MKEIGGYIELDSYEGTEYHKNVLALNCGRSCLEYLIYNKQVKKIYIPFFLCSSVIEVCKKTNIEYDFYRIDYEFNLIFEKELKKDEYLYIVNYYGQLDKKKMKEYKEKYSRIIIDNSQAFFEMPVDGIDTLYTCRKFFGVPDGAYLYTNIESLPLEEDYSYDRMNFLLGRYEKGANDFYEEYVTNNHMFTNEPVKKMSKLTHNLLKALDYDLIEKRRSENFRYLHKYLKDKNELSLNCPQGAFAYPFYTRNGMRIRENMKKKKIYIPLLWPNVVANSTGESIEYKLASNILPLPIDQRYQQEDMDIIIECLQGEME